MKHAYAVLSIIGALVIMPSATPSPPTCDMELLVLGAGQDAGAPQIGEHRDPAWSEPADTLWPTSVALLDHRHRKRFLIEATPAIGPQLHLLAELSGISDSEILIDGVLLTHAHIGHYAGLMYFGREAAGARGIDVFVLPRMRAFLTNHGPWSQLVQLGNIDLRPISWNSAFELTPGLSVEPLPVPHRDEYSETAAFVLTTRGQRVLFVPDIDNWDLWRDNDIERVVRSVGLAFIDATFFDDHELPGRDMSTIPHPRVVDTMRRLSGLSPEQRQRVRFIHYNHTNPIRWSSSAQAQRVSDQHFGVARRGDRHCLD